MATSWRRPSFRLGVRGLLRRTRPARDRVGPTLLHAPRAHGPPRRPADDDARGDGLGAGGAVPGERVRQRRTGRADPHAGRPPGRCPGRPQRGVRRARAPSGRPDAGGPAGPAVLDHPGQGRAPAPAVGLHSDEIVAELGLDPAELRAAASSPEPAGGSPAGRSALERGQLLHGREHGREQVAVAVDPGEHVGGLEDRGRRRRRRSPPPRPTHRRRHRRVGAGPAASRRRSSSCGGCSGSSRRRPCPAARPCAIVVTTRLGCCCSSSWPTARANDGRVARG